MQISNWRIFWQIGEKLLVQAPDLNSYPRLKIKAIANMSIKMSPTDVGRSISPDHKDHFQYHKPKSSKVTTRKTTPGNLLGKIC